MPAGPANPSPDAAVALRPLPLGATRIGGGLWADRQRVNREVTIPEGATRLRAAGNYHNLGLAAGTATGDYRGPLFLDSDVYKWLEAAAWERAREPSATLADWAREATEAVAAAQAPDGYLNSYVQAGYAQRWADLPFGHELYCAGHLIQAAVADHRATGDETLLGVARRFADLIAATFGDDGRRGVGGHPEIETALVELYRETGQADYLRLAGYFVDTRGHGTLGHPHRDLSYFQDRVPVRDAETVEGHAVRALYLAAGVTDVYTETRDESLLTALDRQWRHLVETKTYVTGGVGSRWEGEAFGDPYELPPDRAYCETCAAIASVHWNWRMLLVSSSARFADMIERALLNAFLPGVSLGGREFFYVNALQLRADAEPDDGRHPAHGRQPWYTTACCPPNVMRMLASLEHYVATAAGHDVQLHQYAAGTVHNGQTVLDVATDYPWDGRIAVTVRETTDEPWTLALRVPGWAHGARLDGVEVAPGDYARQQRSWRAGDTVVLELPMPPRRTVAADRVDAVRGCVAIERGPLVYCLEQVDLPGAGVVVDDVELDGGPLRAEHRPDLLGGVTVVRATGRVRGHATPIELTAVPYYAWANRALGPMRVWIPDGSAS